MIWSPVRADKSAPTPESTLIKGFATIGRFFLFKEEGEVQEEAAIESAITEGSCFAKATDIVNGRGRGGIIVAHKEGSVSLRCEGLLACFQENAF